MQAERKSIVRTASSAPLTERSRWLESTLIELGKLAKRRKPSMTPECLLLMEKDPTDVPGQDLELVITGWRRSAADGANRNRWTASRPSASCESRRS